MKTQKYVAGLLVGIGALFVLGGTACTAKVAGVPESHVALRVAMRGLWDAHVTWTRMYIVSAVAGLADESKVADRLLKNQDDIGNAIKPYYGDAAGNELTKLLRGHIMAAGAVVTAAKTGDNARLTAAQTAWTANADSLAAFLAGANPNWSKTELADMLHEHLRLTTGEAVARLKQDYDADIAAYDEIHKQAMMMADALSAGIIKQFPGKFN